MQLKIFFTSNTWENSILLCVFLNTIILSLDGIVDKDGDIILN